MAIKLFPHQKKALNYIHNGSIVNGGTGSGKSITSLAYYYICQGGQLDPFVKAKKMKKLYIITTARKRDELEWEGELSRFLIKPEECVIDSWNNIKKYSDVKDAFFIFDEQRVVGYGTWTKAFLKITKSNEWILLSATPGDKWEDYIPVFIANGFYKNKTEFAMNHIIYDPRCKNFPKIDRYINTGRLLRLREKILVNMDFERKTNQNHIHVICDYDKEAYKDLMKNRYNYIKDAPIENASELCYELRRISNSHKSRLLEVDKIFKEKNRVIIFYNYDYELDMIKEYFNGGNYILAEWNGHKHQEVPDGERWLYLVQYNAGAEAWNCIKTDTIIFFSQNYSYKMMTQASGRIDRLNTPYTELYYYHLKSSSSIDCAIYKALSNKKKFNETRFIENK